MLISQCTPYTQQKYQDDAGDYVDFYTKISINCDPDGTIRSLHFFYSIESSSTLPLHVLPQNLTALCVMSGKSTSVRRCCQPN